jgi:hypothetical protein
MCSRKSAAVFDEGREVKDFMTGKKQIYCTIYNQAKGSNNTWNFIVRGEVGIQRTSRNNDTGSNVDVLYPVLPKWHQQLGPR